MSSITSTIFRQALFSVNFAIWMHLISKGTGRLGKHENKGRVALGTEVVPELAIEAEYVLGAADTVIQWLDEMGIIGFGKNGSEDQSGVAISNYCWK